MPQLFASTKRSLIALLVVGALVLLGLFAIGAASATSASAPQTAHSAPLSAAEAEKAVGAIQCSRWIVREFYIAAAKQDYGGMAFWYAACLNE